MYPQYWTLSIGGIIMKYSYEYKLMCVELYREGKWPETPTGAKEKKFRDMIREWVCTEDRCGPEALQSRSLIARFFVISGFSLFFPGHICRFRLSPCGHCILFWCHSHMLFKKLNEIGQVFKATFLAYLFHRYAISDAVAGVEKPQPVHIVQICDPGR